MPDKLNITTRFSTQADWPELLHLFAKGMRGYDSFPYRLFWEWKHVQNPFGESPVLLALDGKRIIGIRAFMRWKMVKGDCIFSAFRAVDTVTDPDYRGKGVFKMLTMGLIEQLKITESLSFIFNTPNKASRPGYLKMGWKILGRAPVHIRVVPFAGLFNQQEWRQMQSNLQELKSLDNSSTVPIPSMIHVPKNLAYLNWRYREFPILDYALDLAHYKGNDYFFFLKIRPRGYFRELRVCEAWTAGIRDWNFIARHSVELARRLGCQAVSLLPEPGNGAMMYRNGFVSIQPLANIITVRDINLGDGFAEVAQLKNWAFAMGDLELF